MAEPDHVASALASLRAMLEKLAKREKEEAAALEQAAEAQNLKTDADKSQTAEPPLQTLSIDPTVEGPTFGPAHKGEIQKIIDDLERGDITPETCVERLEAIGARLDPELEAEIEALEAKMQDGQYAEQTDEFFQTVEASDAESAAAVAAIAREEAGAATQANPSYDGAQDADGSQPTLDQGSQKDDAQKQEEEKQKQEEESQQKSEKTSDGKLDPGAHNSSASSSGLLGAGGGSSLGSSSNGSDNQALGSAIAAMPPVGAPSPNGAPMSFASATGIGGPSVLSSKSDATSDPGQVDNTDLDPGNGGSADAGAGADAGSGAGMAP